MRELRRFAKDYARRDRALNRERDKLRRDRLRAIHTAHDAGIPAAAIGEELGISKQRVLELLHGFGRP
jgi:hypothetical protein